MNIKVLGMGCANCKRLKENVNRAVYDLGLAARVEEVTDWWSMRKSSRPAACRTPAKSGPAPGGLNGGDRRCLPPVPGELHQIGLLHPRVAARLQDREEKRAPQVHLQP
jgi:Thioredoxin domain